MTFPDLKRTAADLRRVARFLARLADFIEALSMGRIHEAWAPVKQKLAEQEKAIADRDATILDLQSQLAAEKPDESDVTALADMQATAQPVVTEPAATPEPEKAPA